MIFERCGRGKLIGSDVNCFESNLDALSYAASNSFLYRVDAKRTSIDAGHIERSTLEKCHVNGGIITHSNLLDTYVENSTVATSRIRRSRIDNAIVIGSRIYNSTVGKGAVVQNASVFNFSVLPLMKIGCGTWHRQPRFLRVTKDEYDIGVTESTDGHAYIGCRRKPIERWLKGRERFAQVMGWPKDIIDEIADEITQWQVYSTT